MDAPRDLCAAAEQSAIPSGRYSERFSGYGVMGLPFRSGHVLGLRRFPASSIGPAYTSVWHRDPSGRWWFRQDAREELSCPRYFGVALAGTMRDDLTVAWPDAWTLEVTGARLRWRVDLAATPVTRTMNALAGLLPPRAWDRPMVLGAMGRVAGAAMRVGRVRLQGTVPNGQRFQAHPLHVWMVSASSAVVDGEDLGEPGPLPEQAHLGDFRIPQRGVFAIGRSQFEHVAAEGHRPASRT